MNKNSLLIFDAKHYDTESFNKANHDSGYGIDIVTVPERLSVDTVPCAAGYRAISVFVHDLLDAHIINALYESGVQLIALRCSGCEHIDRQAAAGKIVIVHVPAYSPYAIAEHALGLILCLARKIHRAAERTRDNNFSITGLTGSELHGKTIGLVGTGAIGSVMATILNGLGMHVIAYEQDSTKQTAVGAEYVTFDTLLKESDIVSLHCTLNTTNYHMFNHDSIGRMKKGALIINTARGRLIDSNALLLGLKAEQLGGAALDVYEYEENFFYTDHSTTGIADDVLARLLSLPNVIITSHQAFFTHEALMTIAHTTLRNVQAFYLQQTVKHIVT